MKAEHDDDSLRRACFEFERWLKCVWEGWSIGLDVVEEVESESREGVEQVRGRVG